MSTNQVNSVTNRSEVSSKNNTIQSLDNFKILKTLISRSDQLCEANLLVYVMKGGDDVHKVMPMVQTNIDQSSYLSGLQDNQKTTTFETSKKHRALEIEISFLRIPDVDPENVYRCLDMLNGGLVEFKSDLPVMIEMFKIFEFLGADKQVNSALQVLKTHLSPKNVFELHAISPTLSKICQEYVTDLQKNRVSLAYLTTGAQLRVEELSLNDRDKLKSTLKSKIKIIQESLNSMIALVEDTTEDNNSTGATDMRNRINSSNNTVLLTPVNNQTHSPFTFTTPEIGQKTAGESVDKHVNNLFQNPMYSKSSVFKKPDMLTKLATNNKIIKKVEDDEENEEVKFQARSKILRYDFVNSEWKERGVGQIKILQNEVSLMYKILMRRDGVMKLCVNHPIVKDMNPIAVTGKTKEYTWSARDYSEEEDDKNGKLERLIVKFENSEDAEQFYKVFAAALVEIGVGVDQVKVMTTPKTTKQKSQETSTFSFCENTAEKHVAKPTFSFGTPKTAAAKPAFWFGSPKAAAAKPEFSFRSPEIPAPKPEYSFGQTKPRFESGEIIQKTVKNEATKPNL